MNKTAGKILCFSVFLLLCFPLKTAAETLRVEYVADGDSILLSNGEEVRYLGIDTPELAGRDRPAEYLADEARKYNEKLVLNRAVRLEYDVEKRDRHGRLLAYLFLEDGTFVNAELLRSGYAYLLAQPPNLKYSKKFLELQREAIKAKVGLWEKPIKLTVDEADRYLGNRRTKIFHHPECRYRIAPRNIIIFKSKMDAFWDGYRPCRVCRP